MGKESNRKATWEAGEGVWDATLELAWLRNRASHWDCQVIAPCSNSRTLLTELITCLRCSTPRPALLANACGHVACAECWAQNADDHLSCKSDVRCTAPSCFEPHCSELISWGLLRGICTEYSRTVSKHVAELDAAFRARDKNRRCVSCDERCYHFIRNNCGHSVCENCWLSWLERQAQHCLYRCVMSIPCISCSASVADSVLSRLRSRSDTLDSLLGSYELALLKQSQRHRDMASKGVTISSAPSKTEPGPTCIICRDHRFALLVNTPCGHMACENCWANWACSQIDRCETHHRDVGRCFSLDCEELVTLTLQEHLESESNLLNTFATQPIVARRRHLRKNALFPTSLQMDCPQPHCWGLGYLGFDTVMCFICEHQWRPEEEGAPIPSELDVEEVMGVKVKKCPKCHEYIEKNGGCDHMTCRRGHEFWWTTLGPYRR